MVDKNGKKVSQSFDGVTLSEDRFIITNGEKYGLITLQGETIFPSENQGIFDAGQGYFGILDNQGNFGYFDKDGKNIIPAIYNGGTGFVGDYAAVMRKDNGVEKTGVIDKKNRIIVPIIYERTIICNDKNGQPCFWIFKDGVFNEYNIQTKRFTPSRYVDMAVTPYGTLTKSATENYGLVIGNQEIIPPVLNSPEDVANLFAFMSLNDMSQISPLQARTISIRLNPETNKFKLSDKIDNDYWDY